MFCLVFLVAAWFLSETEPFDFKGFSIMCAGFCTVSLPAELFFISFVHEKYGMQY